MQDTGTATPAVGTAGGWPSRSASSPPSSASSSSVGLVTGSLALISDAGHMAADVVALGAALVATKIATRPDGTGRRTYGSYRAEVFASGLTVLIMLGVSVYVVVEAVRRIGEDVEVSSGPMLVVGAIGLASTWSAWRCCAAARGVDQRQGRLPRGDGRRRRQRRRHRRRCPGRRHRSGLWDTVVAVAIGVFVAVRAVLLGREVLAVLGQHAPEGLDLDAVVRDLEAVAGVAEVHDLHAWTLTSGMNVATAHLVTGVGADPQAVLAAARRAARGARHRARDAAGRGDCPARECREATW